MALKEKLVHFLRFFQTTVLIGITLSKSQQLHHILLPKLSGKTFMYLRYQTFQ